MDKIKRIFPLLLVYIIIACLNIVFFAYLYNLHESVIDPSTNIDRGVEEVTRKDLLYFSGITYLTIGYGDLRIQNGVGQFLAVLQGFSGVLINSIFTGLFLYYLVKRPKNIILSNRIYIRYKEEQNKFCLSIRIGNKGRPLVNVNRILELFVYEENIKTRKYQFSQEYHYFENILYWEVDLHLEEHKVLLKHLQSALCKQQTIFIRVSLLGTDADAGDLVFTSKTFLNSHILFIRGFHDLRQWKNHKIQKIQWHRFNDIIEGAHDEIQKFIRLK